MKKRSIALTALCAAALVAGAQAQNSTDPSSGTSGTAGSSSKRSGLSSTDPSTSSDSSAQKRWSERSGSLSATGRSGSGQDVRASKLMNAEIKASSGSTSIGTIQDVIINPTSGKVDFAVISLNSSGSDNSSTTGATGSQASPASGSTSGKLVAVPWHLLRPAGSSSYSASATTGSSSSGAEVSFVFNGDQTKLQAAPTFDQNSWPDFSQPSWRQSVYSHFGTSSGTSTGGATSPGGTSSSSSDSSSSSIPPQSSSSSSSSDSTGSTSKP